MGGGSNSDLFSIVGPHHLTRIDWLNSNHRTAVTSSLVRGVYSMQRDKTKKRKPLANPWWESFDFSLDKPLINKDNNSIYGAVFEYKNYQNTPHSRMPPRYVIAFRGTMLKYKTWRSDLADDIRCMLNNLNDGSRFKHAIQTVETLLEKQTTDETGSVWLAGHSLGAGIALLVGKTMTKRGFPLETYAFSPPISSFPLETLSHFDFFKGVRFLKGLCRFAESALKVTVAVLFDLESQCDPRVAEWTPYVYVNPSDIICSEYIGILNYKNYMADIGLGVIESFGAGISLRSLVFGEERGEPIQLLTSANMTVNMNKFDVEAPHILKQLWYKFKKAHGLEQWWEPCPALQANWKTHSVGPSTLGLESTSSS